MGGEYKAGRDLANSSDYASFRADRPDTPDLTEDNTTSDLVLGDELNERHPSVVLGPAQEKEQEISELVSEIESVVTGIISHGRQHTFDGQENVYNLLKSTNEEALTNLTRFSSNFAERVCSNIFLSAAGRSDHKEYLGKILEKLTNFLNLLESTPESKHGK